MDIVAGLLVCHLILSDGSISNTNLVERRLTVTGKRAAPHAWTEVGGKSSMLGKIALPVDLSSWTYIIGTYESERISNKIEFGIWRTITGCTSTGSLCTVCEQLG